MQDISAPNVRATRATTRTRVQDEFDILSLPTRRSVSLIGQCLLQNSGAFAVPRWRFGFVSAGVANTNRSAGEGLQTSPPKIDDSRVDLTRTRKALWKLPHELSIEPCRASPGIPSAPCNCG